MKRLVLGKFMPVLSIIVLAACGSPANKNSGKLQIGSSACVTASPTAGQKVYYTGSRGTGTGFSVDSDYVGTIVTVLSNSQLEVKWTPSDAGTTSQSQNYVSFETTCVPTLVGKRVLYTGSTGTGTGFPTAGKDYFGNILAAFDQGYLLIDWDAGISDSVVNQSKVSIQQ